MTEKEDGLEQAMQIYSDFTDGKGKVAWIFKILSALILVELYKYVGLTAAGSALYLYIGFKVAEKMYLSKKSLSFWSVSLFWLPMIFVEIIISAFEVVVDK